MIITRSHLLYWRAKHVPVWASKIEALGTTGRMLRKALVGEDAPNVHALINAQDQSGYPWNPKAKRPSLDLHNTLGLLRLVRDNIKTGAEERTMLEYLDYLRLSTDKTRRVWAARFSRKITRHLGTR